MRNPPRAGRVFPTFPDCLHSVAEILVVDQPACSDLLKGTVVLDEKAQGVVESAPDGRINPMTMTILMESIRGRISGVCRPLQLDGED